MKTLARQQRNNSTKAEIKLFNATNAIFGRLLHAPDGHVVTLAYLNTWTGPGTYVLYVINPQLQVVATRMILLEQ